MKIAIWTSDLGGCAYYRIMQPMRQLSRIDKDFQWDFLPFLPNKPYQDPFIELVNMVAKYDLIILQRCYLLEVFNMLRRACDFAGKPLIFETDDDYLNLEKHNPCYYGMVPPQIMTEYIKACENKETEKALEYIKEVEKYRLIGLENYKELIGRSDAITVSTEELKNTLYPYNKNIIVLQNNVERVYEHRDYELENKYIYLDEKSGKYKVRVPYNSGLITIPNWLITDEKLKLWRVIPRIGYTGTPSHRGNDFDSIKRFFNEFLKKYGKDIWTVYVGDDYFFKEQVYGEGRGYFVPASEYNLYIQNIRNIDIGLAPLESTIFNMSKSDIKALEYASWGSVPVVPNYITYNRSFKHRESCMMYDNEHDFYDCLEELFKDKKLRDEIGNNAREYVKYNRLESNPHNYEKRYNFYKDMIQSSNNLKLFSPNKELVNASNA